MTERYLDTKTRPLFPFSNGALLDELNSITQEEIDTIGQLLSPLKKGEKIVGQADYQMQCFVALGARIDEEATKLRSKIVTGDLEVIREPTHDESHNMSELNKKVEIIQHMIFLLISDTVGWACLSTYGLRKGWQICEAPPGITMLNNLGNLFDVPIELMNEMRENFYKGLGHETEVDDFPEDDNIITIDDDK